MSMNLATRTIHAFNRAPSSKINSVTYLMLRCAAETKDGLWACHWEMGCTRYCSSCVIHRYRFLYWSRSWFDPTTDTNAHAKWRPDCLFRERRHIVWASISSLPRLLFTRQLAYLRLSLPLLDWMVSLRHCYRRNCCVVSFVKKLPYDAISYWYTVICI